MSTFRNVYLNNHQLISVFLLYSSIRECCQQSNKKNRDVIYTLLYNNIYLRGAGNSLEVLNNRTSQRSLLGFMNKPDTVVNYF